MAGQRNVVALIRTKDSPLYEGVIHLQKEGYFIEILGKPPMTNVGPFEKYAHAVSQVKWALGGRLDSITLKKEISHEEE